MIKFIIKKSNIIKGLEKNSIFKGRGDLIVKNEIKFINDTYNSNLVSCLNGIKAVAKMSGQRKILVLGDMHELGDKTRNEHEKLGEFINKLTIDAVFCLGEYMKFTLNVIDSKKIFTKHFNSKKEIITSFD